MWHNTAVLNGLMTTSTSQDFGQHVMGQNQPARAFIRMDCSRGAEVPLRMSVSLTRLALICCKQIEPTYIVPACHDNDFLSM